MRTIPGRSGAAPARLRRLAAAGIRNPAVLDALRRVPRHAFMDEALASRAYDESALPLGHGQTISHPYTVARMTEALLAEQPCATVLEIGTGSGFQTAVLALLVRRVYSIERLAVLFQVAEPRLRALCLRNVRLRHGDGALGWPEQAPFDGILLTAAAPGVPRALGEQLGPGGRLVLPLATGTEQILVRMTRVGADFKHEILGPATFVPLLGGVA